MTRAIAHPTEDVLPTPPPTDYGLIPGWLATIPAADVRGIALIEFTT